MIVINTAANDPTRPRSAPNPRLDRPATGLPGPLPALDPARLAQLDAYAGRFADVFARADQLRWFRLYLRGLLDGGDRKNAEAIAARVGDGSADFAQALQHFASHSPWDAGRVLSRYRELLPAATRREPGTWVVHDGAVPKKGRHSVGTQRQFARPLGRKVNCQVAVVVGRAGPAGYLPLAVRLYLPAYWLREQRELAEKTVPPEHRAHRPKAAIARELLGELAAEGWPAGATVADDGYGEVAGTVTTGSERDATLAEAHQQFGRLGAVLGFDHFEGRTWLGWHHHAALVLAAAGFLAREAAEVQ